mmetsp:Transcript_22776/g.71367  ORF Transcript_22776/g.71367 Transcript_22776/m.71367 type:complete len:253 (-) Transcript_22776:357-1115(-)
MRDGEVCVEPRHGRVEEGDAVRGVRWDRAARGPRAPRRRVGAVVGAHRESQPVVADVPEPPGVGVSHSRGRSGGLGVDGASHRAGAADVRVRPRHGRRHAGARHARGRARGDAGGCLGGEPRDRVPRVQLGGGRAGPRRREDRPEAGVRGRLSGGGLATLRAPGEPLHGGALEGLHATRDRRQATLHLLRAGRQAALPHLRQGHGQTRRRGLRAARPPQGGPRRRERRPDAAADGRRLWRRLQARPPLLLAL